MMNKLFVFIWMPWLLFDLGEVQPCRSSHLNGTLSGFHCPCRNNIIAEISMTERWQCFLLCMRHLDCILMEHNEDGKVCKLSKGLCYEAEGRGDVVLTALGPPRLGCVEWRRKSDTLPQNLVWVSEVGSMGKDKVLGRLLIGDLLLPGFSTGAISVTSTYNSKRYSNSVTEFLWVSPGCPILWVPLSGIPGADLPTGALVGGHLDDGTHLYVAKAWVANAVFRLGYYNPVTGLGYFWYYRTRTTSQVSLLMLL